MRIISYGHVKPKEQFCSGCGGTYEYLPKDIQNFKPGTKYSKNYVTCPICGHVTFVNEILVKHDKYMVFQNPDRRYANNIVVDGYFENKYNQDAYTFRVEVKTGFDGPPIGESLQSMIQQSVGAVVRSELAEAGEHIGDPILQEAICMKAKMLTNLALGKITNRMNVERVSFVAICPTIKKEGV